MKIYLDVDGVLFNSRKRIVQYLNTIYNKNVCYLDVMNYDLSDQFPESNPREIEYLFADKNFYKDIDVYKGAIKFVKNHNVIFCTKGTPKNIYHKSIKLKELFPNTPIIALDNEISKNSILMIDDVFIDDYDKNFKNSSAESNIIFKPEGDTNYNINYDSMDVIKAKSFKQINKIIKRWCSC